MNVDWHTSIAAFSSADWDTLTDGSPLCAHAFFYALEKSGSIGQNTGWQPLYLRVEHDHAILGIVPLFVKYHSYGEYVFDWRWASAFESSGKPYYPKLVAAIPFTPIPGARLFSHDRAVKQVMVKIISDTLIQHDLSSAHALFVQDEDASVLEEQGWIARTGVQFRWENRQYASFDDFLMTLSHDKRKKIRQERKKLAALGVSCRVLLGSEIEEEDWDFFYQCYCNTYAQHQSTPYLTRQFFSLLSEMMSEHVRLVVAYQDSHRIAAAFLMQGNDLTRGHTLYGRYWGCTHYLPGLHFEVCYYQAQMLCITQGIAWFEGGAQGEHKLARGFSPTITRSYHKIADAAFANRIAQAMQNEQAWVEAHHHELEERLPYRADSLNSIDLL